MLFTSKIIKFYAIKSINKIKGNLFYVRYARIIARPKTTRFKTFHPARAVFHINGHSAYFCHNFSIFVSNNHSHQPIHQLCYLMLQAYPHYLPYVSYLLVLLLVLFMNLLFFWKTLMPSLIAL